MRHAVVVTAMITAGRTFLDGTSGPGDQQFTVDANVSGKGGVPTGEVTLYEHGQQVGSGTLDSSGNTSIQFYAMPGTTTVYGVYSGDSTFHASGSAKTTVTTTTPYRPTLSTTVSYSAPNKEGAERATIELYIGGVSTEPAPTGTVSADSGFTCGAVSPVTGTTHRSKAFCSASLPSGTDESVNLTFTTGDSNYDSGTTSVTVSNGGDD